MHRAYLTVPVLSRTTKSKLSCRTNGENEDCPSHDANDHDRTLPALGHRLAADRLGDLWLARGLARDPRLRGAALLFPAKMGLSPSRILGDHRGLGRRGVGCFARIIVHGSGLRSATASNLPRTSSLMSRPRAFVLLVTSRTTPSFVRR